MNDDAGMADVQTWADGLDEIRELIAPRFSRSEPRATALAYLTGLLSGEERKNSWTLSERAGHRIPDGMQRLLLSADWNPDEVRDDLRDYVAEHLGDPDGVLIVDETGFLKKRTRSAGDGAKGHRRYAWARARINGACDPDVEYWLLARRSLTDPSDIAYFRCHTPRRVSLAEMVRVAGARWAIEETFQTAKGQTGLDHYQVRSYTGWYRHMTLSMLAHAFVTVTRSKKGASTRATVR